MYNIGNNHIGILLTLLLHVQLMCTICAFYNTAFAYSSAINYWLSVHLVSTCVLGDLITIGQSKTGINMHLKKLTSDQLDSLQDGMMICITYTSVF